MRLKRNPRSFQCLCASRAIGGLLGIAVRFNTLLVAESKLRLLNHTNQKLPHQDCLDTSNTERKQTAKPVAVANPFGS